MLAMRSFARVLPRTALRVAPRVAQRQIVIPKTSILSRTSAIKSFSTSRIWREAAGDSDAVLSARLEYERSMEVADTPNSSAIPADLQEFLDESKWATADQPGTETVVLTKQFGNETIRVEINISDVTNEAENALEEDDMALEDEADYGVDNTSGGKRTINQSGVRGGKIDVVAEDSIAPSDRDVDGMGDETSAFPLSVSITIDKGAIGATNIIGEAQDSQLEIQYVHFYPRADMIESKSFETEKQAQALYGGPSFQYLDVELQSMYENYLQERGINEQLFNFLTRYAEYKEQREYVQWLENMKKFVDA